MSVNLNPFGAEEQAHDTDPGTQRTQNPLVVLVTSTRSYRTGDFVAAAKSLRVDLIVASEGETPMGDVGRSRSLSIDCSKAEWSAARIARIKPQPDAVIAADDSGVIVAAMASQALGLRTNPVGAVVATRDKAEMRGRIANTAVPQPRFRTADPGMVAAAAAELGFPCVVKPRGLSGSRGVIRVDSTDEARSAESRIRDIVADAGGDRDGPLLVESFVSGAEVAVEGILVNGRLTVLALLDKPNPMDGPFFEETMFVTPSRHAVDIQNEIAEVTEAAAVALGLVTGPIHAEVRCGPIGVILIEIAARSIGGLCGRALSFGLLGESLESLILRSALGLPGAGTNAATPAAGVLMLPIPMHGNLVSIDGVDDALETPGITEFDQSIANGRTVVPLPEGDRYLGFLFANGESPDAVERSLRESADELVVTVEPPERTLPAQ
jgi:glutathione synthase/RimK-type ligase-like ATP-grasp enzyme